MVSVPFVSVVSTSVIITIGCVIATILRVSDAPSSSSSSKNLWGSSSHDFFSKDSSVATPTSGNIESSFPAKFYVPSHEPYLSPSISLAYIFTSLLSSSSDDSQQQQQKDNVDLVNNLKTQMQSSPFEGTKWTNVVNTSVGYSNLIELGVVSAPNNTSTSSAPASADSISFIERSIGLDSAPVMVLTQQKNSQQQMCIWKVIVGFSPSSFLIVDPTTIATTDGDNVLASAAVTAKNDLYQDWSCQDTLNQRQLTNLAIAFRNKKL